jgi:8-oxo-dGTP pyrophosphatase MutT (NUDIX family)
MSVAPNPVPRPASTVLLLRDGATGLEVLMITRHAESGFAAGALVFPGGRVDAQDSDHAILSRCRPVAGLDAAAMAFRVAGIRETFEEAHVLLARPAGGDAILSARAVDELETRMRAALGRAPQFADLVAAGGIELATDLLVPYAHWITPVGRPKRYDTHFFLAPVPADQVAAHDGREAVDSLWIAPRTALDDGDAGRASLVFATRMNLIKLARSRDVATALAAARRDTIMTVCPELADTPAGQVLRIPSAAGYGISELPTKGLTRA